jgi:hypothetical protein
MRGLPFNGIFIAGCLFRLTVVFIPLIFHCPGIMVPAPIVSRHDLMIPLE